MLEDSPFAIQQDGRTHLGYVVFQIGANVHLSVNIFVSALPPIDLKLNKVVGAQPGQVAFKIDAILNKAMAAILKFRV